MGKTNKPRKGLYWHDAELIIPESISYPSIVEKTNRMDAPFLNPSASQQLEPAYQAWQKQGQAAKQETHAKGLIDFITGVNQAPKEVDEYGEPVSPY